MAATMASIIRTVGTITGPDGIILRTAKISPRIVTKRGTTAMVATEAGMTAISIVSAELKSAMTMTIGSVCGQDSVVLVLC
ncbi:MAG TPA: hypothetical protein DCY07_04195 [Rhodospirillaceae bacterium]|nr:hypothetical protein [Rhodospirillaceae bacterium]